MAAGDGSLGGVDRRRRAAERADEKRGGGVWRGRGQRSSRDGGSVVGGGGVVPSWTADAAGTGTGRNAVAVNGGAAEDGRRTPLFLFVTSSAWVSSNAWDA